MRHARDCYAAAHHHLQQQQPEEALALLQRGRQRWPGEPNLELLYRLACLQRSEQYSNRLLAAARAADWTALPAALDGDWLSPAAAVALRDDPQLHRACATRFGAQLAWGITPLPSVPLRAGPILRLGYLSADFHDHATARLLAGLIEQHRRDRLWVALYSTGPDDGSSLRHRLQAAADHFVDLRGRSPLAAAQQIRADGIQILIDLKGYTRGAEPRLLALRPAPVQLHYLGYPGTVGAPFVDGLIADGEVADTPTDFQERVWQVPGCYQVNDPSRPLPPIRPRAAHGLPEQGRMVACFNQTTKLTPTVLETWCAALRAFPDTALWLLSAGPQAENTIRSFVAAQGVAPTRLFFAEHTDQNSHLARYHHVALALDTWPYGSHTTGSDALWLGAPLLAWRGRAFAARVAASLLQAQNLPELIADGSVAYGRQLHALLADPAALPALRARVGRARASGDLFNLTGFIDGFEALLAEIWQAKIDAAP